MSHPSFSSESIRHAYCQTEVPRARSIKVREEDLLLSAISASLSDSPSCSSSSSPSSASSSSSSSPSPSDLLRGSLFDKDASTHVAAIVKRGKLLAVGTNRTTGARSRGSGSSTGFSLHAERAAVKALGDMSQLRGADLYVVRIPHSGHRREGQSNDLLYSRPCHECTVFLEKCMRVWGLRRVLYTTDMTMALSPPPCIKEWEGTARPPEDLIERRKWERKLKVQRRLECIRGHNNAQTAAAVN